MHIPSGQPPSPVPLFSTTMPAHSSLLPLPPTAPCFLLKTSPSLHLPLAFVISVLCFFLSRCERHYSESVPLHLAAILGDPPHVHQPSRKLCGFIFLPAGLGFNDSTDQSLHPGLCPYTHEFPASGVASRIALDTGWGIFDRIK